MKKEAFYKAQIKEDILKGSIMQIDKSLKELNDFKAICCNVIDDELLIRQAELLCKRQKLTDKLNKLLNKDNIKIKKLNKKIENLYLDLDFYTNQPIITGSIYIDLTRPSNIERIKLKISKLTNAVIELGGIPVTMEDALHNLKNQTFSRKSTILDDNYKQNHAQNFVLDKNKSNQNISSNKSSQSNKNNIQNQVYNNSNSNKDDQQPSQE